MRLSPKSIADQLSTFRHSPGFVEPRTGLGTEFTQSPLSYAPAARSVWKMFLYGLNEFVARERDGLWVKDAATRVKLAQSRKNALEISDFLVTPEATQSLLRGQSWLDQWRADGWVNATIVIRQGGFEESHGGAVMQPDAGSFDHEVLFNLRKEGQLPSLALRGLPQSLRQRLSCDVLRQQLILAHEAAHTVFAQIQAPFAPLRYAAALEDFTPNMTTSVALEKGVVPTLAPLEALNQHLFGKMAPKTFHLWLDENFADVYGTMLFLRTNKFHHQAMDEVILMRDIRQSNLKYFEKQMVEQRRQAWDRPGDVFPYETASSIDVLLRRRSEWEHLPPDQVRTIALGIISDAWLERAVLAGPARLIGQVTHQAEQSAPDFNAQMVYAFVTGTARPRHTQFLADRPSPEQTLWDQILTENEAGTTAWAPQMVMLQNQWQALAAITDLPSRQQRISLESQAFALLSNPLKSGIQKNMADFQAAHQSRVAWIKALSQHLLPAVAATMSPGLTLTVRAPSLGAAMLTHPVPPLGPAGPAASVSVRRPDSP